MADRDRFTYGYGYFLPWKNAVVPALEAQGADVVCFGARDNVRILLTARRVAEHLKTWGADVVHSHLPVAGVVARLAGRIAGVPIVYTEHNQMERHHLLTRRLNLSTWKMQAEVIAVSDEVRSSVRKYAGDRVPVTVVLNAINTGRFRTTSVPEETVREVRLSLGIPEESSAVGTVCVFTDQKRLDLWLEAAREIRARHPDTHFVLVGDGPLRSDLEGQALRLGLGDVVHFVGLQEDVRPFVLAMDVFMMSSQFEGFGLVLAEAMALERPVVATGVGGVRDIVQSGENGMLTTFGDTSQLASEVSELLASGARRQQFAVAGRQTVETRFSMERMQGELEVIYERVIAEHRER